MVETPRPKPELTPEQRRIAEIIVAVANLDPDDEFLPDQIAQAMKLQGQRATRYAVDEPWGVSVFVKWLLANVCRINAEELAQTERSEKSRATYEAMRDDIACAEIEEEDHLTGEVEGFHFDLADLSLTRSDICEFLGRVAKDYRPVLRVTPASEHGDTDPGMFFFDACPLGSSVSDTIFFYLAWYLSAFGVDGFGFCPQCKRFFVQPDIKGPRLRFESLKCRTSWNNTERKHKMARARWTKLHPKPLLRKD
ncbi:MAG: hypothetical protein RBU45_08800 [Myxococcota bacterium]|jgi:hypothetical protein|nr:hypothetical protein [Myxococcota bacterium]